MSCGCKGRATKDDPRKESDLFLAIELILQNSVLSGDRGVSVKRIDIRRGLRSVVHNYVDPTDFSDSCQAAETVEHKKKTFKQSRGAVNWMFECPQSTWSDLTRRLELGVGTGLKREYCRLLRKEGGVLPQMTTGKLRVTSGTTIFERSIYVYRHAGCASKAVLSVDRYSRTNPAHNYAVWTSCASAYYCPLMVLLNVI